VATVSPNQLDELARAKYKLRQADLALRYLRQVPTEIAADLRKARPIDHQDLRLDTFFFSCLGLAQSAFYIISNGPYKDAIHNWRMTTLDSDGRAQLNKMMNLRDTDVHHGLSEGKALATMIPMERSSDDDWWMYQQRPNYAVFGISPPATERMNPDGTTVRSFDGLQGTMCLYVDIAGETCEASNVCERFITLLGSLIGAVEAAHGAV
jgi:hypothetical protein